MCFTRLSRIKLERVSKIMQCKRTRDSNTVGV
jgi:hypothetical protein